MKNTHSDIHLGHVLIQQRHKHGITQEELAACIGVSKASVSKWETSTTYPDITLLPKLAAFFNISIDELMGYEPQMSKEAVRRLYRQLSHDFATMPFPEVFAHCQELSKKYYSCTPLLFQIGVLYMNHFMFASSKEESNAVLEEAMVLFVRVKKESTDIELQSHSTNMEALCLLQLGRPQEVLDLLSPLAVTRMPSETLLASAWKMLGNPEKARSILQSGMFDSLVELLNLMLPHTELCLDRPEAFEEGCRRIMAICEIFQLETLHPSILFNIYFFFARCFLLHGEKERALQMLEKYTDLATHDGLDQLQLHGDSYFDLLDDWLEQHLALGCDLPRDTSVVRDDIIKTVTEQPLFAPLADDPRFQRIIHRLNACRKDS